MRHLECDGRERQVWCTDLAVQNHFRSFEAIVVVVGSRRDCAKDS